MLDNRHNIRLRLVLDNRVSNNSKLKGVKDPEYPVAIGLYWDGASREKLSTQGLGFSYSYTKYTFKNNKKLIEAELATYNTALADYNSIIDSMPVWDYNRFKSLLKKGHHSVLNSSSLIDQLFDDKIRELDKRNVGSGSYYDTTRKSLISFHGSMPSFDEIDSSFLGQWQHWHQAKTKKGSGFSRYVSCLRAIFNLRPDGQNKNYPFGGKVGAKDKFAVPSSSTNRFFVPKWVMQEIKNADLTNIEDQFARDIFMFSFYAVGMNLIDILKLNWNQYDEASGKINFTRSKSQHNSDATEINFKLPQAAIEIISKHGSVRSVDGLIFNYLGWHEGSITASKKNILNTRINKVARKIAKDAGYSEWEQVSFYRARHSFATNLRDAGVSLLEIKEYLGHESLAMSSLYLGALEESSLDKARDIMDNLL